MHVAAYYCSYGLRDGQTERDSFVIANWVHTFSPKALFSVAPFYHFNQSDYDSHADGHIRWRPRGTRTRITRARRRTRRLDAGWNSFSGGLYSFYQQENDLFGVQVNDGSAPSQPNAPANANAGLVEFYRCRPSAAGPVCHAAGRRALLHLPRGARRERDLSAHRRDGADSAAELGAARILRALLPARADSDGFEFGAELCEQPARRRKHLYAAALGARRGAPVRHRDSVQGMDAGRGHVQESREQLPRPLEPGRIEHVLPHRRGWRAGARMGDDAALAARCGSYGQFPRDLLEPDCASSAGTLSADSRAAFPPTRPATWGRITSRSTTTSATR